MAIITRKGEQIETIGFLPAANSVAPPFTLARTDLSDCTLQDFYGKSVVLNIFPSIDTPTCATSVRTFNEEAAGYDNTVILCISADLPYAHQRFCETEGLEHVIPLSTFRSAAFGEDYGVTIISGSRRNLLSRAIVVVSDSGIVRYTEQVPEITQEPDYEAVLKQL